MTNSPDDPFVTASNPESASSAAEAPHAPTPGFHGQAPHGQQYGQFQQGQPQYDQQYAQPQYGQPQYAQPQYGQPQYAQAPQGPNPATAKNWMGITALVMSLAAIFTGITAIGGIIFGHLGVAAAKRGEADNAGMSRTGMIIGYVFTVLGILAIVGFFILMGVVANECSTPNRADWCG